jgi:hypothetical protein
MRVVFLDFDGCLVPFAHYTMGDVFSPSCVQNFNNLLRSTDDLKIVISSSWRRKGVGKDKEILAKNGINTSGVIGTTDPEPGSKGKEIQKWLHAHPEVTKFVILDDEDDGIADVAYGNLVKTNVFVGLTAADVKKTLAVLGG